MPRSGGSAESSVDPRFGPLQEGAAMSLIDPLLLSFLILILAIVGWQQLQLRAFGRRLQSLEKQHLALVEELEERLYER
jgi:uncharacterized protein HemX